jgi:hypothetical protein
MLPGQEKGTIPVPDIANLVSAAELNNAAQAVNEVQGRGDRFGEGAKRSSRRRRASRSSCRTDPLRVRTDPLCAYLVATVSIHH